MSTFATTALILDLLGILIDSVFDPSVPDGQQRHAVHAVVARGRRSVQLGVGVTEPAGHRTAHLEMELAVWIERDLGVHVLDFAFEIHRIYDGSAHVDL